MLAWRQALPCDLEILPCSLPTPVTHAIPGENARHQGLCPYQYWIRNPGGSPLHPQTSAGLLHLAPNMMCRGSHRIYTQPEIASYHRLSRDSSAAPTRHVTEAHQTGCRPLDSTAHRSRGALLAHVSSTPPPCQTCIRGSFMTSGRCWVLVIYLKEIFSYSCHFSLNFSPLWLYSHISDAGEVCFVAEPRLNVVFRSVRTVCVVV